MTDVYDVDMLTLVRNDVTLRRVAATGGGEYAGPCPDCGGEDRFRVWPMPDSGKGRYWCRRCDAKGDAIDYLRWREPGMTFADACRELNIDLDGGELRRPPNTTVAEFECWQARAAAFTDECQRHLWAGVGKRAMAWLRDKRGLTNETITWAWLGYNPTDRYDEPELWGMPDRGKAIWLPRGVVIPWRDAIPARRDNAVCRVVIRRPVGDPKYVCVPGGRTDGLYEAGGWDPTVVLTEGEFCALSARQAAPGITALATGGVNGSRSAQWLEKLALYPRVYVAFDADDAGDAAAAWWLSRLEHAERLRPTRHDVNDMLVAGDDIPAWLGVTLMTWKERFPDVFR